MFFGRVRKNSDQEKRCNRITSFRPGCASSQAFQNALRSPAPPAARGGIRAACAEAASSSSTPGAFEGSGGVRACIERSLKSKVRTTLRVTTSEDRVKRSWAEVRESTRAKHFGIFREIANQIAAGNIKKRDGALEMPARLVDTWPQ